MVFKEINNFKVYSYIYIGIMSGYRRHVHIMSGYRRHVHIMSGYRRQW